LKGPGVFNIVLNEPTFIVLEAKKHTTVDKVESDAELLGQLRVLMSKQYITSYSSLTVSGQNPQTRIITNGYRWRIHHLEKSDDFVDYQMGWSVQTKDEAIRTLGIYVILGWTDKRRDLDIACCW
jgi:hypothetical protein